MCEERKGQKIYPSTEMHSADSSLRLQMFLPSMFLPPRVRRFLYVAGMRGGGKELSKFMDGFRACLCQRARGAQKVRRNCRRLDTQSDRRAFVRERKMIYCQRGGSNRVHGELWRRRGGAKLWSCWASISHLQFKECVQGCEARKTKWI